MTVNGGKENSEKDRMFEVAADVIRTLDPSIPADKITQTIEHLKNEQYMVKDYTHPPMPTASVRAVTYMVKPMKNAKPNSKK